MSYEINLEIGVKTTAEKVFKTLIETNKLAQWWTSDTRGSGLKVGVRIPKTNLGSGLAI